LRDFFIVWMERIISVVMVLGAVAVLLGGLGVMTAPQGGLLPGLMVWIAGTIYLILIGGMVYLGLGIYNNTKRTAEAIERLSQRS